MVLMDRKADTPEMIEKCLNCPRSECNNCYAPRPKESKHPNLSEEQADLVKRCLEAGCSDPQTARIVGLGTSTVNKYRRFVLGLPARFPKNATRKKHEVPTEAPPKDRR